MNSASKPVTYNSETISMKKGIGNKFIDDFDKRFKAIPELKLKIKRGVELSKEKNKKPLIISFASEKGGCGKSTMAVTTSQLLANMGFKVQLIDVDNNESAYRMLISRKKNIQEVINNAVKEGVDESLIIDFKTKLDPLVDTALVDKESLTVDLVNEIATDSAYDIIVFDTPGVKEKREENFDLAKLNHAGEVHMILAYLSNSIVIPMRVTPLDITIATRLIYPLSQFVDHLEKMKLAVLKTQARILVNSIDQRTGTALNALEEFQNSSYKQFKTIIRRSDKIAFAPYFEGVQTAFTTKVASQMQESFLEVIDQISDDAMVSLGE